MAGVGATHAASAVPPAPPPHGTLTNPGPGSAVKSGGLHHNVLNTLFPDGRLFTLAEFLNTLEDPSNRDPRIQELIQEGDSEEYRSLVKGALVGVPVSSPMLGKDISWRQNTHQGDIVRDTISRLIRASSGVVPGSKRKRNAHILCQGYRRVDVAKRTSSGGTAMYGVESYFPNTIVNVVKGQEWDVLLSRIGDDIMRYLLCDAVVLVSARMLKNTYVQVTGPMLTSLPQARQPLRATVISSPVSRPEHNHTTTAVTHDSDDTAVVVKKAKVAEYVTGPRTPSKMRRPSKWRRARDKKRVLALTQGPSQATATASIHEPSDILSTSASAPNAVPMQPVAAGTRTPATTTTTTPSESPSKGATAFDRLSILYASNVSNRPGFRATHILYRAPCDTTGVRMLKTHIFGTKIEPEKKEGDGWYHRRQAVKDQDITYKPLSRALRYRLSVLDPHLLTILTRHHKNSVNYTTLLEKHCPIAFAPHRGPGPRLVDGSLDLSVLDHEDLVSLYSTHTEVTNFVTAVIHSLIPSEMWGSHHNLSLFLSRVGEFIRLGRYEKMFVQTLIEGMRPSHAFWVQGPRNHSSEAAGMGPGTGEKVHPSSNESQVQTELFHTFVTWCMNQVVMPLLRSHFYITETAVYRFRMFYYRKSVWRALTALSLSKITDNEMFVPLTNRQLRKLAPARRLAHSSVRMLPKPGSMRILSNLSRAPAFAPAVQQPPKVPGRKGKIVYDPAQPYRKSGRMAVNHVLSSVFQVLKFEKSIRPSDHGASLFGYDDIYQHLLPFIFKWRSLAQGTDVNQVISVDALPRLYFVSLDIHKAFDTINQSILTNAAKDLFSLEEYMIQKYIQIVGVQDRMIVQYKRNVWDPSCHPQFLAQLNVVCRADLRDAVVVDQVVYNYISEDEARSLLREHLECNIVKIGQKYYKQLQGIPQGSILSTLLCSLFYATFEKEHLFDSGVPDKHHLIYLTPQSQMTEKPSPFPGGDTPPDRPSVASGGSAQKSGTAPPSAQGDGATPALETARAGVKRVQVPEHMHVGQLFRFVDDFFYTTTSLQAARNFFIEMHGDHPDFGCVVNPDKTIVNFDQHHLGKPVTKVEKFLPWCGLLIDMSTFEIYAEYERYLGSTIQDSVSVDKGKNPGDTLVRRVAHFLKPKCHPLLLDLHVNSVRVIRINVYAMVMMAGMKFYASIAKLGNRNPGFARKVITGVVRYLEAVISIKTTSPVAMKMGCRCPLTKGEIRVLAHHAFLRVLTRKQTKFGDILGVLRAALESDLASGAMSRDDLDLVVKDSYLAVFDELEY